MPHEVEEDFPTDIELKTLRRLPYQLSWTAFSIGIVELCERLTYYGTGQILTNFIQRPLPAGSTTGASGTHGQAGALGFGQTTSSAISLFKQFFFYTTPLLGAYLADAHWGRFRTICVCIAIGFLGHIIFVIAAIPPVIAQRQASLGVAILGIVTLGLSTGGVKTNLAPLIVEQLPHTRLTTRILPTGEKVIYDPVLTINRAYMTWYFMTNVGALLGILTMPYVEKYAGFWVAWLVPTVLYLLCPLVMLWGRRRYNRTPPHASVFAKAFRLVVFSWKHNLRAGLRGRSRWSLVKPSSIVPEQRPKWMTFDDAWVDEIRRCLKAAKVFAWYPLFLLCFNQINNNLVSQAALLELHGLPNEFMTIIDPLGILILVPIFDRMVYPFLRARKVRVSPIRRITAAFVCGSAAMTWAAVLQYHIYQKSPCGYGANTCDAPAPINVGAQAGSYLLIAMGEILGTITILEYSYAKAPKSMRSVIQALALFTNAMAAALGQALVPLTRDPLLVWNYAIPAILSFCAAFCFWFQMRGLDRQEDELNYLPAGNLDVSAETAVDSNRKVE
ncbi:PTR2-domain-containing protein [Thozetella sp. PMI_491]|nr:PTR2-domain-containing protein [Thozetella sp. PMI_491]